MDDLSLYFDRCKTVLWFDFIANGITLLPDWNIILQSNNALLNYIITMNMETILINVGEDEDAFWIRTWR
jgi:hypothetical protein